MEWNPNGVLQHQQELLDIEKKSIFALPLKLISLKNWDLFCIYYTSEIIRKVKDNTTASFADDTAILAVGQDCEYAAKKLEKKRSILLIMG